MNQGWNNAIEVTVEMVGVVIIPPTLSAALPVMMEPSIALVMMMIVLIAPSKISIIWLPTKRS